MGIRTCNLEPYKIKFDTNHTTHVAPACEEEGHVTNERLSLCVGAGSLIWFPMVLRIKAYPLLQLVTFHWLESTYLNSLKCFLSSVKTERLQFYNLTVHNHKKHIFSPSSNTSKTYIQSHIVSKAETHLQTQTHWDSCSQRFQFHNNCMWWLPSESRLDSWNALVSGFGLVSPPLFRWGFCGMSVFMCYGWTRVSWGECEGH